MRRPTPRSIAAESEPAARVAVNAAAVADDGAECGAQRGIRLVHVSTDFVFDGTAGRPYRRDDATTR